MRRRRTKWRNRISVTMGQRAEERVKDAASCCKGEKEKSDGINGTRGHCFVNLWIGFDRNRSQRDTTQEGNENELCGYDKRYFLFFSTSWGKRAGGSRKFSRTSLFWIIPCIRFFPLKQLEKCCWSKKNYAVKNEVKNVSQKYLSTNKFRDGSTWLDFFSGKYKKKSDGNAFNIFRRRKIFPSAINFLTTWTWVI